MSSPGKQRRFFERGGNPFSTYYNYSLAAPISYDLGWGVLESTTGLIAYELVDFGDFDFTSFSFQFLRTDSIYDSISEEIRLRTTLDLPVTLMGGAYYQKERFQNSSTSTSLPVPQDPVSGRWASFDLMTTTDIETWSGFGQLVWDVTDDIELAAGARYNRITSDVHYELLHVHTLLVALFPPANDPVKGDFGNDDLSPEVTLTWRTGDLWKASDLTVYGAYKESFKSGGFAPSLPFVGITADDMQFDGESVAGFEGGIKSTWFGNTLSINLTGYDYKFDDLQVFFFDAQTLSNVVNNAASASTTGVELDFKWLPPFVEGLDLHGSFTFNQAAYDKYLTVCYGGQTKAQGCNLDDNGNPVGAVESGTRQELGGRTREMAPDFTGALGFLFEVPLVGDYVLALSSDANWIDTYELSSFGRPGTTQDSFFRTDASLTVARVDGAMQFSVIGRNLSNTYSMSGTSLETPLTAQNTGGDVAILADQVGPVNRPRQIGFQLSLAF